MLPTLVNHTTQNTSHTQPQLTSQLQYTTNQPHTTLKTEDTAEAIRDWQEARTSLHALPRLQLPIL